MKKFHISHLSKRGYARTIGWAIALSGIIVISAAGLGRAAINLRGALTEKPDVAIYLLLPDEGIGTTTLLREKDNERDYLAETAEGPKLIKLKRGPTQWFVAEMELLRE